MKLLFDSQEDLLRTTERLITILGHERYWTRRWMERFGSSNRTAMENWQKKADEIIQSLGLEPLDLQNKLKVEIKQTENEQEQI